MDYWDWRMDEWEWAWRTYRRSLAVPMQTTHGIWRDRPGILLRLTREDGTVRYGEIAPLPWFGSETLEQAEQWCRSLPARLTPDWMDAIPDTLPACQFGFAIAGNGLVTPPPALPLCGLLPTGAAALAAWESLWTAGYHTFKWKIGVAEPEAEWQVFEQLCQQLPSGARLRLDANGGLTLPQAAQWLECCDRSGKVEYLEQPLPPSHLATMQRLQADYATAIALDESVTTLAQLQDCVARGWTGVVVLKWAIAGSPSRVAHLCQTAGLTVVGSSVLETAIGRWAGLHLSAQVGDSQRATGYGVTHWFVADPPTPEAAWNDL